ncbi:MAG: cation:proton antiporter [Gaiellaceae bacterium]
MGGVHFGGLLIVVAAAFAAPLLLGLVPSFRLPAVILEIVAGIVLGPSVLGWVVPDQSINVLATIGLAFLLFLAGLEIDLRSLRGRPVALAGGGFVVSFAIALVAGFALHSVGLAQKPLFIAIVLTATSLGIIVPILKDAGEIASPFGQLLLTAGSIADFGAIILLSLFFSRESTGVGAKLVILGGFAFLAVAIAVAVATAGRSSRLSMALLRLQDTTAQIRVRGAFVLLIGFAALAQRLGLETILGAFIAGAVLTLLDKDREMTHPDFRHKLEAAGFGIFIPIFFVTSGIRFDGHALFATGKTLAEVPVFLGVLLLVRGLPALAYRSTIGARRTVSAVLLQATSLPFIVAATMIGVEIGTIDAATAAALVGAGILSVLIFPLVAISVLRAGSSATAGVEPQPVG